MNTVSANKVSVVVAVEPRAIREALIGLLSRESDIEVTEGPFDPVELMVTLAETRADVAVLELDDSQRIPGVCTHLFAEFPGLLVVGICPKTEGVIAFRQTIRAEPLAMTTIGDLVAAVRSGKCVE